MTITDPNLALATANAMLESGRLAEALDQLREARDRYPWHAGVAARFADGLQSVGRLPEAVTAYALALQIDPASTEAWYGAGCAHLALGAYGAAAAAFGKACRLRPVSGAAHYNLAAALFQLGRLESAIAHFERAARLDAELEARAQANIACIIPGSMDADNATVLRVRRLWADQQTRALAQAPRSDAAAPARDRTAAPPRTRKPRIGYLSAFFGNRNWMKAVFALINRHDRAAFEIHMFSDGDPPSSESGYRDHDADVVHDMRGADNERAAAHIAECDIDVLVDLNGYSFPSRLPLLMNRPAKQLVGWFNMFATTGLRAFDWIVGDAAVIPSREEPHYCEKVHRLPGTYTAFEVRYPVPEVAPPPCLAANGAICFGYLGSQYKLTDAVIGSWAAILQRAPKADLFIKTAALDDGSTKGDLRSRFEALGVDAARLRFAGSSEHFAFLGAYRNVDIALDT
ncbi:MAG TPA: tetratricopeptide repeat protein, partial [Steroidobacteraceae bacterium]|nr:tetratricopeptide repeat protein [Steroidobacteraceae bacterium]